MATEVSAVPKDTTFTAEPSSAGPVKQTTEPITEVESTPSGTTVPTGAANAETPTPSDERQATKETSTPTPAAVTAATTAASKPSIEPIQELWNLANGHSHAEIWGVTLADPASHVPSQIVLQKFLNANDGDLVKAQDQLTKTLDWRAKTKPLDLINRKYSTAKFDGLGYVTIYNEAEHKEVFTWNIYGGVKNIAQTFGNVAEFIEWRTALMEIALQDLSIATATKPITAEDDPYKIYQVHDYKTISFFRSPPEVRSASKETIAVFAQNYPELLKEKFFVNVPAVMGFMYGIIKVFVPAKTVKKFHPMSDGGKLSLEFADSKVTGLGEKLPKEYGGKGEDLKSTGKEPDLE